MTDGAPERQGLILATLLATSSLTVMAGATVSPALPAITAHFAGAAGAELLSRLVLTLPALFIALCSPLGGMIADRIGRRPLLVWSTALYAVTGSAGLFVDSLVALLVSRALLGVAVGGLMTASTTLIGDYFSDSRRNRVLGLQAACMAFGGVVFLVAAGFLADVHWRMPFLIYGLPILLLPLILVVIREPDGIRRYGTPGEIEEPAPWGLISGLYFLALMGMGLFYLLPVQLPYYLGELGYTKAVWTGLALGLNTITAAMVSLGFRHLRSRFQAPSLLLFTFLCISAGMLMLYLAQGALLLSLGLILTGLGLGVMMPNLSQWLLTIAPRAVRGRVISGLTTSIFLGQFLSPLLSQPIIQALGLRAGFGLFACVSLGIAAAIIIAGRLRHAARIQSPGG